MTSISFFNREGGPAEEGELKEEEAVKKKVPLSLEELLAKKKADEEALAKVKTDKDLPIYSLSQILFKFSVYSGYLFLFLSL